MGNYSGIAKEKLLKMWQEITRCYILSENNFISYNTGYKNNNLIVFKRDSDFLISPRDIVTVKFIHDTIYMFKTKVKYVEKGIVDYYHLEVPKGAVRVQRRGDFRLEIESPVFYEQNDVEEEATMKDISATGIKIAHKGPIDLTGEVKVKLSLGEDIISLKSHAKYTQETREGFLTGLEFINITEFEREVIVRFIFMEVRKRRKTSYFL